jgi:hypothetical protein
VRTIFLSMFVALLHDYRAYIQYIRRYPTPVAVFNKALCLRDNTFAARFLADFIDTQAFSVFLHQRHSISANLFDEAVDEAGRMLAELRATHAADTIDALLHDAAPADANADAQRHKHTTSSSSSSSRPPALTLLHNGLAARIGRLACLASDIEQTYVAPAPQVADIGSATTFDYAAADAPAFPAFDASRFPPLRSDDVDLQPLAYISASQQRYALLSSATFGLSLTHTPIVLCV